MPRQLVSTNTKYRLQFDGVQNYLSLGTMGNFGSNLGSGFYCSFQIQTISTTRTTLFGVKNSNGKQQIEIGLNTNYSGGALSGYLQVYTADNGSSSLILNGGSTNSTTINNGSSHTVTINVNFSSNTISLTIDGSSIPVSYQYQQTPATFINWNESIFIGATNNEGAASNFSSVTLYNLQIGTTASTLYGSYNLIEGSGTTTADSSGNGNTGGLEGYPAPAWVTISAPRSTSGNRSGIQSFPSSLFFNGSAKVAGTGVSLASSDFTIMFWCKCSLSGTFNMVYSLGSVGGTDTALQCLFKNSVADLGFYGDDYAVTTTGVLDNTWHFWAFSFQTSTKTKSIYRDGTFVGSATSSGQFAGNTSFAIGVAAFSGDNLLGYVCGLYVYNKLLSQGQIAAAMGGNYPAGAVGIYQLNEGAGSTAYDTSGNSNNGTITSAIYTTDTPVKGRQLVGGNLVYNGGFEYAPPTITAQTTSSYMNGTSAGSTTMYGINNTFGWYAGVDSGGTTIGFTTAYAHTGNYSVQMVTTAGGNAELFNLTGGYWTIGNYSAIPCSPNTSYTASVWVNITAASGSSANGIFLAVYRSNGSTSSGNTSSTGDLAATTSGWTQLSTTFTTTSTECWLHPMVRQIGSNGAATLAMTSYVDDISIVQTSGTGRGSAI